ncbi:hypothetical protein LXA43DRAFT_1025782 [Ganoderma leucocontextum]|nr:hypothetical protein LXA43DRAFT_1025782 [Ganoderma leucocontextum]
MFKASRSRICPARFVHTLYNCPPPFCLATGHGSVYRRAHSSTPQEFPAGAPSSPIPPTFHSLYRLLLRSTAASVLSQPHATSTLRNLWRPVFVQAASIMGKYRDNRLRPSRNRRISMNEWLHEWDRRIDNTLMFLYSSAVARGVPHQVTRNIFKIALKDNIAPSPYRLDGGVWDGTLPPNHPAYTPGHVKRGRTKSQKQREKDVLSDKSSQLLNELIGMAEGFGNVSLGRLPRGRRC